MSRIERDSLGEVEVPQEALYGAQTQRAINNFAIANRSMPKAFIEALIHIKMAAAAANKSLATLEDTIADAIIDACQHLLADDYMQHFPVDVFQTGSGTSTNMNANEVIARLASQRSGEVVNANDHVNYGQSSNDVIPTAIHVAAVMQTEQALLPALEHASTVISDKARDLAGVVKTGRTHLMDAMPVQFSQSLTTWQHQLDDNRQQLTQQLARIRQLPMGGTAVGTGVNTHKEFAKTFNQKLNQQLGTEFSPSPHLFTYIASQDAAVALSGSLKTIAVSQMKIANDLRWMNSGPLAGLGEIELQALQPGSSIMPGKVNPVIPEAAAMVSAQVMGNDVTIAIAGQSGNFELNVMLPVIADNLLASIALLGNSLTALADDAIAGFSVRHEMVQAPLAKNPILVTALNPIIGYAKAADIAKQAYKEGRPVIDVALEQTDMKKDELERLLNPATLT
ncbi:class II fumarate hydratase [Salinibius halmophilus]|uniref:class II fumarate hydratase n=1 Tax=Salinibius halmophilus TaxID=1853216 RepID=UPI000E664733|nr:class II fumarate hydratase [Salinibius halmophilus]